MKVIFSAIITLFLSTLTMAQDYNPYQSIGKKGKILTLSKGRYVEAFDDDSVQRIGTVLFNIRTKKIVKLLDAAATLKKYSDNSSASRWYSPDPLAAKYYSYSPYNFTLNNPILLIDPMGKDVYRYDDKTGNLILAKKTDDKTDQIGKFKYNKKTGEYTLKTNRKGEAKTSVDGIEKGILKDGINFKDNNHVIEVGGKGQPTQKGVENFVLSFSNYLNKEIAGYGLAKKGASDVSYMYIGYYKNNTDVRSYANYNLGALRPDLVGKTDVIESFHSHLSIFGESARLNPSEADLSSKANDKKSGVKKFIIITNPENVEY
jgi:hypothetical protein